MSLKTLSQLADKVPPIIIDAALASFLGVVGAAQVASQRTPFNIEERRLRPPPGFPGGPPIPGGPNGGPGGGPIGGGGNGPPVGLPNDTLTYVLLALCAASLLFRRRFPLVTLAGVTLFGAIYLSRGQPPFSVQLIMLVAIYGVV